MTNLGTWIDTETPERPWVGTQDLRWCMRQRRTVIRRRIIPSPRLATREATCKKPWEEETFLTEDGYEYNDWDESWQQYPVEEYDDWEEEADLETFLAGESDWIHRDVLDSDASP